MIWRVLFGFLMIPAAGAAQDFRFEWQGGGGYSMRGAVSFAPGDGKGILTQNDVQCFEIEGFLNGEPVGRWALGMLAAETFWLLEFDPRSARFLTPYETNSMPQAWNMSGLGDGCGAGGFGFNLGSAAQDICIDDRLIEESQIDPPTPFPATEVSGHLFSPDACMGTVVTSRHQY